MAEILASWLNEEVGLSKKVSNFEEDFASGYLLGELLYKYNQQADFVEFSRKDAISHKLQNFEKLEPTLRNLNIKFDSKMVDKIMKRERGLALRLLYQLKMCLEKVYPTADMVVLQKTGHFGDNQPAQKIAMPKEKYDKVQHAFFKSRINALNKPQKTLNMEAHVKKFEDEMDRQAYNAADLDARDVAMNSMRKQEMRRIQINKLQRNAGFMEEWHQKGVEDWKKNQKRQRDRESRELEFNLKQVQKYNNVAENKLDDAKREVEDGIAQFENTLRSVNADQTVTDNFSQSKVGPGMKSAMSKATTLRSVTSKVGTMSMTTKKGAFTLESTGLKHKTKKTLTDKTRKQREKRRRRLIGQQEELMQDLELKQREALVLELIKKQSNQEKELDYQVWRTDQCKEVMTKNRQLRETQYERRKELDTDIAQQKEVKMLQSMQEATQRLVAERSVRKDEMFEYKERAQTKSHTELCAQLFDQIFDIADEAYNHKQLRDSQDIDPRNWHEWQQLFLNDMPISKTHSNLASLIPQETGGEDIVDKQAAIDSSNVKLDDLELVDYLKNLGQWTSDIVSENKPKIEDILNPVAEVDPKGKGKAAPKAEKGDAVNFEDGDMEIEDKPLNNVILGDAIEEIIKINYEQRSRLKHPQNPNWLPLKICLSGYPFAGKSTQADMIKLKYGLDIYRMDSLLQEALEFAENHPDPIEKALDAEEKKEGEDEKSDEEDYELLSEDEDGDFNLEEDFRQCGLQIQELLLQGEEVTDELYVKMFVTKLRVDYVYKSPVSQRKEVRAQAKRQIEIKQRIKKIEEECASEEIKKKAKKALEDESETLAKELEEIAKTDIQGWVLVDFPCSYAQSKLLEEALSGYKPNTELDPITRDQELEEALLLVQPTAKETPPKTLIKSGIDTVIWFSLKPEECQRRADGRRLDGQTPELVYHVTDVQPPVDQAPLCERLEPLFDESNHGSGIVDRFVSFDLQEKSMHRWLTQFGNEDKQRDCLQIIDADKSKERVFGQILNVIDEVIQQKNAEKTQLRDVIGFKIQTLIDQKLREELAAKLAEEEEERKKQEDALAAAAEADEVASQDNKTDKNTKDSKKGKDTGKSEKDKQEEKKTDEDASKSAMDKTLMNDTSVVSIIKLPDRDNIDNDFKPVIIKLWQDLVTNYKGQMKKIFRNIRMNREQTNIRTCSIREQFLEYLHTLDGKQDILDEFVLKFNQFSDDYPDLREDEQTKEELHQRTDALSDELWEIVEDRKDSAIEFRKKIMESGTVEFNLAFLTQCAQQLMQAEVDKFKIDIQILHDYYHAIEEKLIPEAPPSQTAELGFADGDDAPLVENLPEGADAGKIESYSYPRLDRLLAQAIKQQVVPDVTLTQAAADPKKGGAKKDAKKGKDAGVEEEKPVEDSIYVKEMKDAIKVEKSILRYRLVQVRNWTLQQLKNVRINALDLYRTLEDWILVSQKVEMDAIDEMCMIIKDHIEEETKIQDELRIKFMDFTVDQGVLNYINPPPPKLPAQEEIKEDRFTIPQIQCFIEEFEMHEKLNGGSKMIKVQTFYQIMNTRQNCSKSYRGIRSGLPQFWLDFDMYDYQSIIRNLDRDNQGLVNWRQMISYLILVTSPVMGESDAVKLLKASQNGLIDRNTFVNLPMWFDDVERSQDRDYSIPFERTRMIKETLFDVNCRNIAGKVVLNVETLIEMLRMPALSGQVKDLREYNDFLLAPVRTIQK